MLNKIKIGPKLIAGFLIVAVIAGVIGIVGIFNITKIAKADTFLYENMTVPLGYLLRITEDFQRVRVNVRDLLDAESAEDRVKITNIINGLSKQIVEYADKYEKTIVNEAGKKLFNNFIEARLVYRAHLDETISLVNIGKIEEAKHIVDGVGKESALVEQEAIDKLQEYKLDRAKQIADENTKTANFASAEMITIAVIGVIFSLILGIFLSLSITKPVNEAAKLANSIADGDLNIIVPEVYLARGDEIGDLSKEYKKMINALKYKSDVVERIAENDLRVVVKAASEKDGLGNSLITMVNSLNEIIAQVSSSVEMVSTGSSQVAQASQSLSQGATEQASSLEEITSSITEINSQAKQNAENALTASSLAKKAMENSEMGNKQMKDLVSAMSNITKSAEEIKRIVKVIDDIAFQTNLLALNANVEAARAGKYGKGFAVVAEEVRNLASRSAESVKETTGMVEEAVKNITNGNKLVDITAKQLEEITSSSNKVADLVEEISTASKEQTQGLEQINQGLGQIDQVTQSNTASAEESASAAEELASQSEQLKVIISKFKLSENARIEHFDASNKMITRAKEEIKKVHAETSHMQKLHNINTGFKGQVKDINRGSRPVNPKDVIKLDDDNFGKF